VTFIECVCRVYGAMEKQCSRCCFLSRQYKHHHTSTRYREMWICHTCKAPSMLLHFLFPVKSQQTAFAFIIKQLQPSDISETDSRQLTGQLLL